jgi:16S rRNA processing protein RimM
MDEYIRIGRVVSPHGLDGRVKVMVTTDIEERFEKGKTVFIGKKGSLKKTRIARFNIHKGKLALLALEDINDRTLAETIIGLEIFIDKSELDETRSLLKDDEFYYSDLIGCRVFKDGKDFGECADITRSSTDVLVIKGPGGREFLVPFVESMVDTSKVKEKIININPIEGLFDTE